MSIAMRLPGERHGMRTLLDRARCNRYLLAALIGNLGVWALTALVLSLLPRSYVVERSMILPSSDPDAMVSMADVGQAYATNRATYDSKSLDPRVNYRAVLSSAGVLRDAAAHLGLSADAFGESKIKLLDQSSIIQLRTAGASAAQAEAKAQALYQAFSRRLDELRASEASARDRGIEAALGSARRKLEAAQANLIDFKVSAEVVSARQLEDAVARIGTLDQRHLELSAEVARLDGQQARLAASLHLSPEDAGHILVLQADSQFLALLEQYAAAVALLADYAGNWGSRHPQVASARAKRDSTFTALARRARTLLGAPLSAARLKRLGLGGEASSQEPLVRELVATLARRGAAVAELQAVGRARQENRESLNQLAHASSQLDDLERRVQFSEAVFNAALGKMDIGRSNIFSSYPLVQLLEAPRAPQRRDRRPLLLALAGALGCSLLLSLALTLAWLRKKAGAP